MRIEKASASEIVVYPSDARRFRANLGRPPFLIEGEVVVSLVVVQVRA
jgi:hypothetical protein